MQASSIHALNVIQKLISLHAVTVR